MKHLRKFLNFAACAAVILSTATLASCGSDDDSDEPNNGGNTSKYEAVDLGLTSGTQWATMNVGASKSYESGSYFAWGETSTKAEFTTENYKWYKKYPAELLEAGVIDAEGHLNAKYDAATANWGSEWCMPSCEQVNELINECTWEWTSVNGNQGYKVTGPNGKSIFFPTSGYVSDNEMYDAGTWGNYWTLQVNDSLWDCYELNFDNEDFNLATSSRYYGQPVRPVKK